MSHTGDRTPVSRAACCMLHTPVSLNSRESWIGVFLCPFYRCKEGTWPRSQTEQEAEGTGTQGRSHRQRGRECSRVPRSGQLLASGKQERAEKSPQHNFPPLGPQAQPEARSSGGLATPTTHTTLSSSWAANSVPTVRKKSQGPSA